MRSRASGRLFRKAWTLGRQPHGAFGGLREEESVPFSDVQQSQRLGWDDDPEGVADTANLQFQRHVITIGITGVVVKETIARWMAVREPAVTSRTMARSLLPSGA